MKVSRRKGDRSDTYISVNFKLRVTVVVSRIARLLIIKIQIVVYSPLWLNEEDVLLMAPQYDININSSSDT